MYIYAIDLCVSIYSMGDFPLLICKALWVFESALLIIEPIIIITTIIIIFFNGIILCITVVVADLLAGSPMYALANTQQALVTW